MDRTTHPATPPLPRRRRIREGVGMAAMIIVFVTLPLGVGTVITDLAVRVGAVERTMQSVGVYFITAVMLTAGALAYLGVRVAEHYDEKHADTQAASKRRTMPDDPRQMSQRELDDYLDDLTRRGLDHTKDFERAYAEWERRDA